MGDRALRRRCDRLVESLDLPASFDAPSVCDLIAERRGRRIVLLPMSLPVDSPCGMLVRTGSFDAIFFEQETSQLHQLLIVGHELGHILAGHDGAQTLDPEASRLLLPDLDPGLVHRFLGRTDYSRDQEREAEMIASLLVRRANQATLNMRMRPTPGLEIRPELVGIVDRLEHSLEHAPNRQRRTPNGR